MENFYDSDLSCSIKILQINDDEIELYKKIVKKNNINFIGIEVYGEKIICGGTQYLCIIEKSNFFGYSLTYSINLNSFINNLVKLNSDLFLISFILK